MNTAFSPAEQSAIAPMVVDNGTGSGCSEIYSSEDTEDLVFLFGLTQAKSYFASGVLERTASNTAYAEAQGAPSFHGNADWWLRTPDGGWCYQVRYNGTIESDYVIYSNAVRPVIRVKTDALTKSPFQ